MFFRVLLVGFGLFRPSAARAPKKFALGVEVPFRGFITKGLRQID